MSICLFYYIKDIKIEVKTKVNETCRWMQEQNGQKPGTLVLRDGDP